MKSIDAKGMTTLHFDDRERLITVINRRGKTLISSVVYVGNTEEFMQLNLLEKISVSRDVDGVYTMTGHGVKSGVLRAVFLNQESGAFMWLDQSENRQFVAPVGCAHIRIFGEVECKSCKLEQVT